jgi:hypothetical protein
MIRSLGLREERESLEKLKRKEKVIGYLNYNDK